MAQQTSLSIRSAGQVSMIPAFAAPVVRLESPGARILRHLGLSVEAFCQMTPEARATHLVGRFWRNHCAQWTLTDQQALQRLVLAIERECVGEVPVSPAGQVLALRLSSAPPSSVGYLFARTGISCDYWRLYGYHDRLAIAARLLADAGSLSTATQAAQLVSRMDAFCVGGYYSQAPVYPFPLIVRGTRWSFPAFFRPWNSWGGYRRWDGRGDWDARGDRHGRDDGR